MISYVWKNTETAVLFLKLIAEDRESASNSDVENDDQNKGKVRNISNFVTVIGDDYDDWWWRLVIMMTTIISVIMKITTVINDDHDTWRL